MLSVLLIGMLTFAFSIDIIPATLDITPDTLNLRAVVLTFLTWKKLLWRALETQLPDCLFFWKQDCCFGSCRARCIATIINLMFRPTALHFFGFAVACVVFDVFVFLFGHKPFIWEEAPRLNQSICHFCVFGSHCGLSHRVVFHANSSPDKIG